MTATTVEAQAAMHAAALLGNVGSDFFDRDSLEDWQLITLGKIAALRGLHHNWNSYGSVPVSDETVDLAQRLIGSTEFPRRLQAPRVMPIGGGGIQLAWEHSDREVELVIHAESGCELLVAAGDATREFAGQPLDRLPVGAALRWMIEPA